jgi:thioredoxin-like negative regulator of GroEL
MTYIEVNDDDADSTAASSLAKINKHVEGGGKAVIALTSSHCGPCIRAKAPFKGASRTTKGDVLMANVDVKHHSELNMDTNVNGFPTFRAFNRGKKVKDYEGERNSKDIASFANAMAGGRRKKRRKRKTKKTKRKRKTKKARKTKKKRKSKKHRRKKHR